MARRYRLLSQLGAGGMGEVWHARHEQLRTDMAIKFVSGLEGRARATLAERFRFEAQVAAQLGQRTRHVVAVHDAGQHQDIPFLVMELVSGGSLEALLEQHGPLSPERCLTMVKQLADALTAAHAAEIWHRDIKPGNIMVSEQDGQWLIKLTDFGVAKAFDTQLDVDRPKSTTHGVLVGTPAYMSPEQISAGDATAQSDLWSLAVVVYQALTGALPFDAPSVGELMLAVCKAEYLPPSQLVALPPAIDAWMTRAFAHDPTRRFDSASAMAEQFERACSGVAPHLDQPSVPRLATVPLSSSTALLPSSDQLATPPQPAAPAGRRYARWLLLAAVLLSALLLALWLGDNPGPQTARTGIAGSTTVPLGADPVATAPPASAPASSAAAPAPSAATSLPLDATASGPRIRLPLPVVPPLGTVTSTPAPRPSADPSDTL